MSVELSEDQLVALSQMHNGCILCGGTGTGKSRTSLAYFHQLCGGEIKPDFKLMSVCSDLYIITTARKRDTHDWDKEMAPFLISNVVYPKMKIVVDSWNNLHKYSTTVGAFFIFDEQRVVGDGAWVTAFLQITKANQWILLSATPGDNWGDYIPVFIANGFYRNRTEFNREHATYKRLFNRMITDKEHYVNTKRLEHLRDSLLVDIEYKRSTEPHYIDIDCEYNRTAYREVIKNRWDPFKNEPIQNASGICYILRKIVNLDNDRMEKMMEIIHRVPRVIIFYNFDDELFQIKKRLEEEKIAYAEWNGHSHEPIPDTEKWAYVVQYTAGCEGWNCITTDTIIFYSQNYSYKVMVQAAGRTDRRNTKFHDLYYYNLKSRAPIDIAIRRALDAKADFNERRFVTNL